MVIVLHRGYLKKNAYIYSNTETAKAVNLLKYIHLEKQIDNFIIMLIFPKPVVFGSLNLI